MSAERGPLGLLADELGDRIPIRDETAIFVALGQVKAVIDAAKNVLEYLDGMEIPYKDQHRPLQALHEALAPFTTPAEVVPVCDYCDEGNVAVDGWHDYPDEDLGGGYSVPCVVNPPRVIP